MASFADLLDKLSREASTRDATTSKEKCPKKHKPAIFVMVVNLDTSDPVAGIEVVVGKPTDQKKKTDGDGMAKFDPAKKGTHVVRFNLSGDLAEKYSPVPAQQVTTGDETTSALVIPISPLPSLQVTVERTDDNKGIGDAMVELIGLTGSKSRKETSKLSSGIATFTQVKPGTYDVKVTFKQDMLKQLQTPAVVKKTVVAGQTNVVKVPVAPRLKVDPTLKIEDPKALLVRRDYMDKPDLKAPPHRLAVQLGVTNRFDGTGRLTCKQAAKVKVFTAPTGGSALAFPIPVGFGQLNQAIDGKKPFTLYLEGMQPSAALNDVELNLELQGGTNILGAPVTDKLTCVRLKLEICKCRTDATVKPAPLPEADKVEKGRYVHVQDGELQQERARLIVHRAEPAAFQGKLRLQAWDNTWEIRDRRLGIFDTEQPAKGQKPIGNPYEIPPDKIPVDGLDFWVEGQEVSEELRDTAIQLGLNDLEERVEGDRVSVTAIKTTLQICQSKTEPDADPVPMSDEDQVKKGRFLHEQDDGFHHGRALVIVKKVKPSAFVGKLTLTVWDVTAKSNANPRVELFKAEEEVAANGQTAKANPYEFDHDGSFPAKGLKLWAQGKASKVSGALRDTEIRLGVKDHIAVCGRAAVTVVRFKKLKADVPSTPANLNRLGNSPVPRHELVIGAGAIASADFDEDFATNKPLPLVEDSIKNTDPIKLSVEVEPATAKDVVSWSVRRDRKTTGDHAKVKALKGNDDVTITQDAGDRLKATMLADNVGSFHIRPYIDCNGSTVYDDTDDAGKRIDREPYIAMNLVLIRVKGVNNLSVANSAAGSAGIVKSGAGRPRSVKSGDFLGTGNDAVTMKATARVIGGGQDGKRGLDMLFTGWVNNEANCSTSPGPNGWGEDVTHSFQKGPPPPNPVKRTRCYWAQAAVEITGPMLDSGYANQGTGGNSCTGTAGSNGSTVTKSDDPSGIGQKWEVLNPDSPGGGIKLVHPTDAAAVLTNFKFNIDFRCELVFWTNRDKVPGPSDAPASRLYSSVQTNTWNMRLESNFGAAYAETVVTAKTVTFNKDGNATRLATPVDGAGLETRLPDGLNSLQADVPF